MFVNGVWTANVVRFPVETRARPSLALLDELAPDSRALSGLAEAMELEAVEFDLRHRVDRETAEYVAGLVSPVDSSARREMLCDMREKAISAAIAASAEAVKADDAAHLAHETAIAADRDGSRNAAAFLVRAERLFLVAAETRLEAHRLSETASGVCRALGFALADKPWTPFDVNEATEWLIEAGPEDRVPEHSGP